MPSVRLSYTQAVNAIIDHLIKNPAQLGTIHRRMTNREQTQKGASLEQVQYFLKECDHERISEIYKELLGSSISVN